MVGTGPDGPDGAAWDILRAEDEELVDLQEFGVLYCQRVPLGAVKRGLIWTRELRVLRAAVCGPFAQKGNGGGDFSTAGASAAPACAPGKGSSDFHGARPVY